MSLVGWLQPVSHLERSTFFQPSQSNQKSRHLHACILSSAAWDPISQKGPATLLSLPALWTVPCIHHRAIYRHPALPIISFLSPFSYCISCMLWPNNKTHHFSFRWRIPCYNESFNTLQILFTVFRPGKFQKDLLYMPPSRNVWYHQNPPAKTVKI